MLTAGAVAITAGPAAGARSGHQKAGGTLTVFENATFIGNWPEGLDPATNLNALANASIMDAIYGELFEIGPNASHIDDLASGYQLTNGARTFTIHLRTHVSFTDGTPFNAAAVVYNFKRDLVSVSPAKPPWPPVSSITAVGPYTVRVQFKAPDGAAINQFQSSNVNWIASPTALRKLGAKRFALYPVGAGPFRVVNDVLSNKLVLRKNPHYWQAGHPYLDGLTFLTVANDEAALEGLQAGSGDAYEFMGTPQLVPAFKKAGFTVTEAAGTVPLDAQINTLVPPFNNKLAREAFYYATDAAAINKSVFDGTCPVSESFTGPGGLFYQPKVPGYRTYDLVAFRLASNGPFTGVRSPQIDKYIAQGISSQSTAVRARAYTNLARVLSNQAVTPFICTPSSWDIAKQGVQGPGLTSVTANVGEGPLVLWEDVSVSH